ncbi:hypothetical protein [Gilvimarinus chinensis]|uniref:hypothetical protein n=1 Tax=Gilvimarinus chinensis TaxID=396005 RepID=UPI0003827B5E|nr:hypothetical protein [Gilvimarinus chinensis]
MTSLNIAPIENAIAMAPTKADVNSYQVSKKKGNISGVAVSVSGAGAWGKLSGGFDFKITNIETSKTYQEMRKSYGISGGISAFWSWLGVHANAEAHKEEIKKVFHEVQQSQQVNGHVNVDLEVTGQYPNVEVTASAFIFVLQISSEMGNTYVASSGDPKSDVGAQDENGGNLPTRNNDSSMTFS